VIAVGGDVGFLVIVLLFLFLFVLVVLALVVEIGHRVHACARKELVVSHKRVDRDTTAIQCGGLQLRWRRVD
jgi:hypothetical protein